MATVPRAPKDVVCGNSAVRSRTALLSPGETSEWAAWPISRAQPSMDSATGKANFPLGVVYLLQGLLAFELELCTLLSCLLGSQMGPGSSPKHIQVYTQHLSRCLADSFVPQLSWMHKPVLGLGNKQLKRSGKQ